ncbi:MAG: lipid-A-disaccharide synthase [Terriglobales bacterium]
MKILLSAGEASGENYGAQLIAALKKREPSLDCYGVGGERMRAAGCRIVVDAKDTAVVGLAEVVTRLPKMWGEFRKLLRAVDANKPDGAVLIDFPDWNLRLARELYRRKIPVVYYVSPQLWAWRPKRIAQIKRYVRKMLVIFPFEEAWYRERGVEAEYVGHPLADLPPPGPPPPLRSPQIPIALLPGSRKKEIFINIPAMLQAARALGKQYQFIIPVASTVSSKWMVDLIHRVIGQDPGVNLKLETDARIVLSQARAAVVASGTATVEAALIGTPFVMVYRVTPLTWKLGRRLVSVPFFAMPNLIVGREVVPELVQDKFTPDDIVARLNEILVDGLARQTMLEGLKQVRAKLAAPAGSAGASDRAADAVLTTLTGAN